MSGRWGFVGRAPELSRLHEAATGGGGLVLSGVAGIGKSRLLREAVAALPADQYAVRLAAANIGSSGLPFGGLAQVLPPDPPAGLSAAGLLRWAAGAVRTEAGGRPVVLAVDDAHLLDPPSAALVHLLVREGATLLATLRTGEPVPAPIGALWTEGLVAHAQLAPLDGEEAGLLLAGMLGGPVDPGSARRLTALAGGNPLLLRELVMAGEMHRVYGVWRWTGRLDLAPSLADLADARIGGLTPGVREVLELVAFGEPIGLPLLLKAATSADVESAEERGLIRVTEDGRRHDVRLAHPLYGEVARRQCGGARSHRLLATLADLVEAVGARRRDDVLRVAVWRLDSGTAQDGTLLLDAAVQAFGRFDLALAARLARAARDAGAGYDAAELLAFALLFADEPDRAATILRDAADAPAARRDVALATVAYWGLADPGAADRLAAAHPADAGTCAYMRAVEALMRLQSMDMTRARELARSVLDDPVTDLVTHGVARSVLAFLAAVEGDPDTSSRLLADLESMAVAWRRDTPALQYALPMTVGTRVSVALDLAGIDRILTAEFADLARTGGFGFGSGWVALLQAQAAWLRGRTQTALEASELACAALAGVRWYAGDAHSARAHIAALQGDAELATSSLAIADAAGGTGERSLFYPWRWHSRAWVAACTGDIAGAVRILQDLVALTRADGFAAHELLALHDLVRLDRADLAAERMRVLVATTPAGPVAALLARHARAAADASATDLIAVARQFRTRGYLTFAAEAAAGAVRLFRAARDPQSLDASTLLGDVLERCDTLRTPALRTLQPSLTTRERQVAELAAGGVKSRDIADRLYLSPRTVENHLQRVYAKLGVNSRLELAPALRSLPQ